MIFIGFGPVWRAVLRILREKLKGAEQAYRENKLVLERKHRAEVARLKERKAAANEAKLHEEVNKIFAGIQ